MPHKRTFSASPRRSAGLLVLLAFCGAGAIEAGEVTLLSRADPARAPDTATGHASLSALSADGRWVAFEGSAPNLIAGQSGPEEVNIFLHDRQSGTTILVSRAAGSATQGGNGFSAFPSISDDGRYVYFASEATDLVAGQVDAPDTFDVFVFDRVSGATALVSHADGSPATAANGPSHTFLTELTTAFLSADGRYAAFTSSATNLVAGQADANSGRDVFLYDRVAGTSRLASHVPGSPATAGNGESSDPFLSADGRWLVFESHAWDLVPGETDGVYLFDGDSGDVSFVAPGSIPKISADGAWIVFISVANNLVPDQDDSNGTYDVFLAERATGAFTLVSHTGSPTQTGNGGASPPFFYEPNEPVLSADGRYVAFVSKATNLVAGQDDRNTSSGEFDVFLFDRITGTVSLVSGAGSAPTTQTGNGQALGIAISADGRYVTFSSQATDLVAGQSDSNGLAPDVFLYDRVTATQALVSHTSGSATATSNGDSFPARISADGSRVAFRSRGTELAAGILDDSSFYDVFLFEVATGVNTMASRRGGVPETAAGGVVMARLSTALSHDGRWVAFVSGARDMDAGVEDPGFLSKVFLFDRLTSQISLVSRDATTGQAARGLDPLVSADGSSIAFLSSSPNVVPGQVNPSAGTHLFLFNRSAGTTILVSHAAGSAVTTANQGPATAACSASGDGRWITFTSTATDLVAGQVEGNSGLDDVFLFDRATGTNVLVSHAAGSPLQTGSGASRDPAISADGRWVAFSSTAPDLVAGTADGVYLWDRATGGITWVGPGSQSEISDDGRWVVFLSTAADIVPGQTDTNAGNDVFLWDRITATTTLVSRSTASATTAGNAFSVFSFSPQSDSPDVLSADGRWVVFVSEATDLVPGVVDGSTIGDVFLFDRVSGTTALVSHTSASLLSVANSESSNPGISADGSHVVFLSRATNLIPGQIDTNANRDAFLYSRQTGAIRLVSRSMASPLQTGDAATNTLPRISADGAFVAFSSSARDLASGDFQEDLDAFLYSNPLPGRDFFTLPPCRLFDSREPGQGPALASGVARSFLAHGACGIPATARAVAVNVTVTGPTGAGHVTLHPGDASAADTSTLNFSPGQTRANNAVLSLALDGGGTLAITPFVSGNGRVHVIVDIVGYFE